MSYKTKYKEALKTANITESDLMPKVLKQLEDVRSLEQALKNADEEDKDEIESTLESLDNDLCKKIARNEQMKATVIKMQAARGKGKVVKEEPKKEPIIEPIKETVKQEPKLEEGGEVEKSSGAGWFFGIAASIVGVALVGKWQKWF
jgi:phosphoenolpyruvate carboxylase